MNQQPEAGRLEPRLDGVRALIVDDVAINQLLVREALEQAGASVVVASDGHAALRAVEATPFDVVLMDVQMPGMDGFTATRAIRADERFANLPIIALTAHAVRGDRERCIAAGMTDYVSKPIDVAALLATIATHVGRGRPAPVPALGRSAAPPTTVLDLADALAVLGGNAHAFHAILHAFAERHATTPQQLRDAVRAGDLQRARALLHELIGVAGNLRAWDVHTRARELQGRLRREALDAVPQTLDELERAVARLVQTIAELAAPAPRAVPAGAAIGAAELLEVLARLDQCLAINSMDALDELALIGTRLARPELQPVVEALVERVQVLEFPAARALVRALRERLTSPGGAG